METKLNKLHENLQVVYFNKTAEIKSIVEFYTELVTILSKTNELNENEVFLANCCILFVECIASFLERCESIPHNHVIALQKCLQIIGDVSKIKNFQECYVLRITIPLLQIINKPDNLKWFNKELLQNLKTIIKDCDECLKGLLVNKNIYQFCKLVDELCICGDFEYQSLLLEIIIMMFSDDLIRLHAHNLFPESQLFEEAFCKIDRNNLFYESRTFLNILNSTFKNVRSFKFEYALMDENQISPPKNLNGEPELWVDFNVSSEFISIPCSKSTFSLDKLSESEDEEVEIIKILFANVVEVKMSKFLESDCDDINGCLILFLLKTNSVILSSQNLSKEILKLIVFNSSIVEVLEQDVLPLLFKDRFLTFNVSNTEVQDAEPCNAEINDKSLSRLISTSPVSDALSLKSKLQYFIGPSFDLKKNYISKEPNIKDVEELVTSNNINKYQESNKALVLAENDDDVCTDDDEDQILNKNQESTLKDDIIEIKLNDEKNCELIKGSISNEPNTTDHTNVESVLTRSKLFQAPVPKKLIKIIKNRKRGTNSKPNTESRKFENSSRIQISSLIDPSGKVNPNQYENSSNSIIEIIRDDNEDSILTPPTISSKHNERECEKAMTSTILTIKNRKATAEVFKTSCILGLKRSEQLRSPSNILCAESTKIKNDKFNNLPNRISFCKRSCKFDTKSSKTTISDNYSQSTLMNDTDNCNENLENFNINLELDSPVLVDGTDANYLDPVSQTHTVPLSLQVKTTTESLSDNFELRRNEEIDQGIQLASETDADIDTDLRTSNDIDSLIKEPSIFYRGTHKKETVTSRSVSVIIDQAAQDAVKSFIEMQTAKLTSQFSSVKTPKTKPNFTLSNDCFNETNDNAMTFIATNKQLQPTKLSVENEEKNNKRKLYSAFDSLSMHSRETSLRSSKKFKLYNPNNPTVVSNWDVQLSDVNLNMNQLLDRSESSRKDFLKSLEHCDNTTLVADYEVNDVNVKNSLLIKSKQLLKTTQIIPPAVNGKYTIFNKIDRYIANHSRKINKFIRSNKTMISDVESKKCIDLLENLCSPLKMSNNYLFKRGVSETSMYTNENLNDVLYKKKKTRYSKLKVLEESTTNIVVHNRVIGNGFNNLLQRYMKSFLKTNETIRTSINTGENNMSGENLLSIAKTILQHDCDTYTLMQKAVSSGENNELVDVLDELKNILEEYLESVK